MRHGSANAVCSFQATGLCNLFANPGYCGTTGSWLRRSDARRCSAGLCQAGILLERERTIQGMRNLRLFAYRKRARLIDDYFEKLRAQDAGRLIRIR